MRAEVPLHLLIMHDATADFLLFVLLTIMTTEAISCLAHMIRMAITSSIERAVPLACCELKCAIFDLVYALVVIDLR